MDAGNLRPQTSGNVSENLPSDVLLQDGYVYKTVIKSSVVVRRKLMLYGNKFVTYHNFEVDKSDKKVWEMNRKCKLDPKSFDEIKEVEKIVRPPGVWTIQTAFGDVATEKVKLWTFTLTWPPSWAPQGYTSFTLGVSSREEAQLWFTKFEAAIEGLKEAKRHLRSMVSGRSSSRDSDAELLTQTSLPSMQTMSVPISRHLAAKSELLQTTPSSQMRSRSLGEDHVPSVNGGLPGEGAAASKQTLPTIVANAGNTVKFSADTHDKPLPNPDPDSPAFHTPTAKNAALASSALSGGERWVPYKHVNGVAIYYNTRRLGLGPGPEYMASAVVRGSPKACVDTLMNVDSNTTILGPAQELQILKEGQDRQVMKIRVSAPGVAGKLCAPRELVVERLTKKEEEGIYAILFHSCQYDEASAQELAGGLSGWWRQPVTATVTGGYTIAPLEGRGDDSEECLVTCVLHLDLGAQCSERSWFWPVSDLLGLKDAFVERMLMSVILIKDEIEHKRFVVQPFTLMLGDNAANSSVTDAQDTQVAKRSTSISRSRAASTIRRSFAALKHENVARINSMAVPTSPTSSAATSPMHKMEPDEDFFIDADKDAADGLDGGMDGGDEDLSGALEPVSTLDEKYWCEIHRPGSSFPFKVRGAHYLKDKVKVQADEPVYELTSVDLVLVDQPTTHIARFLPSIRRNGAAFSFICQLIIPGTPVLGLVVTFSTDVHPLSLGTPPDPSSPGAWRPFDYLMHRFLNAPEDERNGIFKLIPHIAEGSWVIRQSVGTTPVILGRKLKTKYTLTDRYIEVDVDISANSTAAYVVNMVKGATKSLVIDMSFVLEGQSAKELPEVLLGVARFIKLDLAEAKMLDTTKEIDMLPVSRTSSSVSPTDQP